MTQYQWTQQPSNRIIYGLLELSISTWSALTVFIALFVFAMASPAKIPQSSRADAVRMITSTSKGVVGEESAWIQDGVKNQIFKRQIFQYQMLLWNSSWVSRQARKHSKKCTRVIWRTGALSYTEVRTLCNLADANGSVQEDKIISHAWLRSPAAAFLSPLWKQQYLRSRSSAEGYLLTLQIWHFYESWGTNSLLSKAT